MISTPLRSVCIVMMSAIGDVVHVLPLVTALKRHSPDVRITWILQPAGATLVRGHWAVDEIIEFDRALGWRAYPAVRRALANRTFDVVLALQVYFKAGIVTSFGPSRPSSSASIARAPAISISFSPRIAFHRVLAATCRTNISNSSKRSACRILPSSGT